MLVGESDGSAPTVLIVLAGLVMSTAASRRMWSMGEEELTEGTVLS